ncbi:ABC transporter substrate-binding protein [Paenibacillus solisilvae]|uniref:ABC transporter substrate-binding protein n=1 Tax=Paenibacillus solisilvae TaxID=2486751 RepID=A0ABW0VWA2_9BACL
MFKKKPRFIVIALMIMLAVITTGCGSSGSADSSNAAAENEKTPAEQPAAANTESSTLQLRTYKTDKGDVEIPVKPQRIVTDYYGGELLSVGANVVGVEPTAFDNPFIKDLLKDAKDVGTAVDPEKALALKPDLIVVMYDTNYDALSKIAPTILIPYGTASNIYETVRMFGDIAGTKDKAEEFLVNFDKKALEGREKLKGIVDGDATFDLNELTDKGELWIFGDNAGRGGQAVYNALKLKMPEKLKTTNQTTQISLELLSDYSADYMFLTTYDPEKKGDRLKQLKDSPIWKNVKTVKNNKVFFNDFDTYYRYDPIAVTAQIDLFVDMLLKRHEENQK